MAEINMKSSEFAALYKTITSNMRKIEELDGEISKNLNKISQVWKDSSFDVFKSNMEKLQSINKDTLDFLKIESKKISKTHAQLRAYEENVRKNT